MASNGERTGQVNADEAAAFFGALVRVETRLYNGLNDTLRGRHGIVGSQYEFLHFLHTHPRARVADLARAFAVGLGATSKGIDRLEARGWVRRVANPNDRRSSLLELTPPGRELLELAKHTFDEWLGELMNSVTMPHNLASVTDTLQRLQHRLEDQQIGTPTG